MSNEYPGYTPMTDAERRAIRDKHIDEFGQYVDQTDYDMVSEAIERAVLARLPKPDAEPVAWKAVNGGTNIVTMRKSTAKEYAALGCDVTPLYAHPPKPDHVPASPEVEALVDAAVEAGRINDKRNAERDALCEELDTAIANSNSYPASPEMLKRIRAHLVGGGE